MKTLRSIESIIPPPPPHFVGDGFRVHNFFPGQIAGGMKRTDPFLLLDYGSPHVFTPTSHRRGVDGSRWPISHQEIRKQRRAVHGPT